MTLFRGDRNSRSQTVLGTTRPTDAQRDVLLNEVALGCLSCCCVYCEEEGVLPCRQQAIAVTRMVPEAALYYTACLLQSRCPSRGICRNKQCPYRQRTDQPYTLHADLVGAHNIAMRTVFDIACECRPGMREPPFHSSLPNSTITEQDL